jgi:hypothetical protein
MATEERQMLRGLGEIIVASPRFATAPLIRRWHLRWGASDAEVAVPMPGDELVPRSSFTATRAVTIDAPPEAVWPWLVQLGCRRAGWYTYDLFDNAGYSSANRILPEHQNLKVGDWVPMAKNVNDTTAFTVAGMESNGRRDGVKPLDALAEAKQHLGVEARSARRRPHPPDHTTEGALPLAQLARKRAPDAHPVRVRRLSNDAQALARHQTSS